MKPSAVTLRLLPACLALLLACGHVLPRALRAEEPDATEGPALALLDAHLAGRVDATPTLRRFEEVLRLVGDAGARSITVPAAPEPTPLDLAELALTHDRVVLGPGTYDVVRACYVRASRGPFEIRGAGRGETVLRARNVDVVCVLEQGVLAGLIVRDLTFDGDFPNRNRAGDLLDVRGRAAAVFERVALRNWSWSGYCAPVGNAGRSLLAFRDCVFVGGYKRGALRQDALAVRGPMLFLFDRCRFVDLEHVLGHPRANRKAMSPRSVGCFEDCTFESSPLASSWWADGHPGPWYPIHVRGGRVLLDRPSASEAAEAGGVEAWRRRWWVAQAAASIRETTYGDAPIPCTPVHLRRVLEAYEPPAGRRVEAVRICTWHGCIEPVYAIYLDDVAGASSVAFVHLRSGGLVPASPDGFDLRRPALGRPAGGATLRELVEEAWDRLDPTRPVGAFVLHSDTSGAALLLVLDRHGRQIGP